SGRACRFRRARGPRGSRPMWHFRLPPGGPPRRGIAAGPRTSRVRVRMASSRGDAPRPGRHAPSPRVAPRTARGVARTRAPVASRGHLPDRSLGLEPLARDTQRILAFEPCPERQRHVREGPVADVLSRERVLVPLRPEIAWFDRDDADAGFAQLVRERLAQEIERGLPA